MCVCVYVLLGECVSKIYAADVNNLALCKDAKALIALPRVDLTQEEELSMVKGDSVVIAENLQAALFDNDEENDEMKEDENEYEYGAPQDEMNFMHGGDGDETQMFHMC